MNKTENKIFKIIGIALIIYMIAWFWPVFFGSNNNDMGHSGAVYYAPQGVEPVTNYNPPIIIQEPMADGYEDPVANTPYDPVNPDTAIPPQTNDDFVACTMEAKQCPDGSYVGRQGPKCEFAKCPDEK